MKSPLFAALVILLGVFPAFLEARTLTAGKDANTLQGTIDLAEDDDIVVVPKGVWKEHLTLTRRITLRGEEGARIDGGGEGTVIRVSAAKAVVENLEVYGSGPDLGAPDTCIYTEPEALGVVIKNNTLHDCTFGIWVHESDEAQIIGNNVQGATDTLPADRGNGIHLFDVSRMLIKGNVVAGGRDGIYVSACDDGVIEDNHTTNQRYGVHYMFSYRNTLRNNTSSDNLSGFALMQSNTLKVVNNTAINNVKYGILFRDATKCVIEGNHLERNGQGMFFFSSTENEISHNMFLHNEIGAKIWAGTVRNQVHSNAFVGNANQLFYVGTTDLNWGKTGGNYWSDYVGWDHDGDGLGDRPYRLDSFTSRTIHKYPAAVLLMRSPALELLAHLEERLPLLRVPTVVDWKPMIGRGGL